MSKRLGLVLVSIILFFVAGAQTKVTPIEEQSHKYHEKRYVIYFPIGLSEVQEDYSGNAKTLQIMRMDLERTLATEGDTLDSLTIFASTSPEGPADLNDRLAVQRANNTKDALVRLFPQFKDVHIDVAYRANDWSGMLLALRQDTTILHREELIAVLNNPRISNKDWYIRHEMPEAYAYFKDNIFDTMRAASVTISVLNTDESYDEYVIEKQEIITPVDSLECHDKTPEQVIDQDPVVPELVLTSARTVHIPSEGAITTIRFSTNMDDGVAPVVSCSSENVTVMESDCGKAMVAVSANDNTEEQKYLVEVDYYGKKCFVELVQSAPKFYMAAKTNTLYDLALIPNLGAEFYLGKNFSVVATAVFSWWKNDNIFWYWRTYGADLTLRYWFGKRANEKPLTGHHVGIYGHALTYDFEAGGRGYLAAKPSVGYGVEYGYSLPIAKRLNLDFNIGFGYFGGEFEEYLPIDGHYVWQVTKHRHWVGPTKMEVSLSWLLGRGNVNKGKGGKR